MTDETIPPLNTSPSAFDDVIEVSDANCLASYPLVSVLMITYNHAEYLAEAIESVISQKCEFPIELIIGEDASTDESREIVLDYQRRFPEIVRVVYSAENVGRHGNSRRIFAKARGEYVAYCEGDDYWCSQYKLARQVGLIRKDPNIGIVHADWVRTRRREHGWTVGWNRSMHRRVPLSRLEGDIFAIFHYPKILRTCTVLVRRSVMADCLGSELGRKAYKFGDAVRAAYTTSRWMVGYLPEVMAVYRESPNSVLRSGKLARMEFLKSSMNFDTDARQFFADRKDYPYAYRWEVSVGLFLWSISAGSGSTAKFAFADIRAHFSLLGFIAAGWRTLVMRRLTLRRQRRDVSDVLINKTPGE